MVVGKNTLTFALGGKKLKENLSPRKYKSGNQMIKIEFKEAQPVGQISIAMFDFADSDIFFNKVRYRKYWKDSFDIRAITPYIPTEDPMLDRSHILSLMNRSEQEDKLFQEQYKNV